LPLVAAFSDLVSARITCRRARARFDLSLDCVLQVSEQGGNELRREAADDHNESEEAKDHCAECFSFLHPLPLVAAYKNSMEPRRGYKDRFRFSLNSLPRIEGPQPQYLRGFSRFSTCGACRLLLYRASALIAIDERLKFARCPSEVALAAHPVAHAVGVLPVPFAQSMDQSLQLTAADGDH
jgi:hypothetical protein